MPTAHFRGGCLTGPNHSGVELHGFLSDLVKIACTGRTYTIFGYKGKQVRDQIHCQDVVAITGFIEAPRSGEVCNLGGGRSSNASILECFSKLENLSGRKISFAYEDGIREGDHICYILDMAKFRGHYPGWNMTRFIDDNIEELFTSEMERLKL